MGTYADLTDGETFETPSRAIDDATVRALIEIGGYTHPLFTDPSFAASTPFGKTPVPGEGIVHMMGGLVEGSGRFDDTTIALVSLEDVRFRAPAFAGDTIRVEVETLGHEPPRTGRGAVIFTWRCLNQDDTILVEARARMLFRVD